MANVTAGRGGKTLAGFALGLGAALSVTAGCEVRQIILPYESADSRSLIDAGELKDAPGVNADTAPPPGSGGMSPVLVPGADATTCVVETSTQQIPLGIYAMVDQSDSMAGSRWDSVVGALTRFVDARPSQGMFFGIQYFPLKRASTDPLLGLPTAVTLCSAADYATPKVPVAELPGISPAIVASLEQGGPTAVQDLLGFPELVLDTPTDVALEGAIEGALLWRRLIEDEVARAVAAVLLVTDGLPEAILSAECNPSLESTEAAARRGFDEWGVRTYVLGVGDNVSELDRIAVAGGTNGAFLVPDEGELGILLALDQIRDEALRCELAIPPGDTRRINVNVQTAGAAPSLRLQNVVTADGCGGGGGWYYDDPMNPSHIVLCDETCQVGRVFEVELGCETVTR